MRNARCVAGSGAAEGIVYSVECKSCSRPPARVGKTQRRGRRTVYFLGHEDTHLDKAQLVKPVLEVAHELLKHINCIRLRELVSEELEQLERQLVP